MRIFEIINPQTTVKKMSVPFDTARLKKWVTDKKAEAVNSAVKAPFIPLRLVEPSIQTPEAAAQPENRSEIEVLSPTGFVVRLKGAVDVESVKRIFTALEK